MVLQLPGLRVPIAGGGAVFDSRRSDELVPNPYRGIPGDPGSRLVGEELVVRLTLATGLTTDELNAILSRLAQRWAADDAIAQLRALARDAKLELTAAIDQFESRIGFMAARGIDTAATRFSTAFGRGVDYYTGFEFELHAKGNGVEPLVAGGRYDGLMTQLGAPSPIPAVGFSVWVEALTQLGRGSKP